MNPYQGGHDGVDVLRGGQHVPGDLVRDLVQLPDLVPVRVEDGVGRVGLRAGLEQQALGCNSIDIWNLRLELGRKLRQGLRTGLGTHFLFWG